MKLIIWRQFGSNHSASYTIVAVFPSVEGARVAMQRVNGILLELADYYAEDESRMFPDAYSDGVISPIEMQIAAEFQIEWKEPLLWFENTEIKVEKQILIIVPEYPSDSGTREIEAILQKLGARVAVDGGFHAFDDNRFGFIEISCSPPSKLIAETLLQRRKGTYQADTGMLKFEAFRFYPVRDFLSLLKELESLRCQSVEILVFDKPV